MKWRILKNAELFELFLAKGILDKIKMLGTSNQNKFDKFILKIFYIKIGF